MMTWNKMVALEPKLAELLDEIRGIKDDRTMQSFCANAHWRGEGGGPSLKDRMSQLVGWHVRPGAAAELRTQEAYRLAYETLFEALPDCRHDSTVFCPLA